MPFWLTSVQLFVRLLAGSSPTYIFGFCMLIFYCGKQTFRKELAFVLFCRGKRRTHRNCNKWHLCKTKCFQKVSQVVCGQEVVNNFLLMKNMALQMDGIGKIQLCRRQFCKLHRSLSGKGTFIYFPYKTAM